MARRSFLEPADPLAGEPIMLRGRSEKGRQVPAPQRQVKAEILRGEKIREIRHGLTTSCVRNSRRSRACANRPRAAIVIASIRAS